MVRSTTVFGIHFPALQKSHARSKFSPQSPISTPILIPDPGSDQLSCQSDLPIRRRGLFHLVRSAKVAMSLFVGTNPEESFYITQPAQNRKSLLEVHGRVSASRSNQSITATNQTCQARTRLESSHEWLWKRVQLAQWRTYLTDRRRTDR